MSTEKLIDIYRKRDFGDLLQDTLRFTFANSLPLLKAILIFIGPLILLSIILGITTLGGFFNEFQRMALLGGFDPTDPTGFLLAMYDLLPSFWVILLFVFISLAMAISWRGTFYGFFLHYGETKSRSISISSLKNQIFKHFFPYLGLLGLRGLISIGFALFSLILSALLPDGLISSILNLVGSCLNIYVAIAISFVFIIRMNEGPSNINAFRRAFQIIKGHWWETFALYLVLAIIVIFIALIGVGAIVLFAQTGIASSLIGGIITVIISACLYIYVIYIVGTTFLTAPSLQYFNLISKSYDAGALIDDIGTDSPQDPFAKE